MMKGIIGRKIGMTRIFDSTGLAIPVTVIEAGPCPVVQIKTKERDGYSAIQLGFQETRKATKPLLGHFEKNKISPQSILSEFPIEDQENYNLGQTIKVDIFSEVDRVDITGISKGRGFAGVVKRHGFAGGPKTHGQTDRHRAPGAIGSSTYPGRVWKGMRMAGHMGNERVTVQNLKVIKVDKERNLLLVKGAVPGANKGYLIIRKSKK